MHPAKLIAPFVIVGLQSCWLPGDGATSSDPPYEHDILKERAPKFSPADGTFDGSQLIEVNSSWAGDTIYYTTDGSSPTSISTFSRYQTIIRICSTTTIRAVVRWGNNQSTETKATFVINTALDSVPWSPSISYGTLDDVRDGQHYKTIMMGHQNWMAENLAYNAPDSRCYDGRESLCTKYGRLYDWATAMDINRKFNATLWGQPVSKHRGICPSGWHIPSQTDWSEFAEFVRNASSGIGYQPAFLVKATSSWTQNGNGTDLLGFRALGAGEYDDIDSFKHIGRFSTFLSSTESSTGQSYVLDLSLGNTFYLGEIENPTRVSLRCIQD